jgi:hypothetical protein
VRAVGEPHLTRAPLTEDARQLVPRG